MFSLPEPVLFAQMSENAETTQTATFLLEGNETRRVSGTDTGSTVLDGLAAKGSVSMNRGEFRIHVL